MLCSLDYFLTGSWSRTRGRFSGQIPKCCPPSQCYTKKFSFFLSFFSDMRIKKRKASYKMFPFVCFDVCILSRLSPLNGKSDCRSHSPKSIRKEQNLPKRNFISSYTIEQWFKERISSSSFLQLLQRDRFLMFSVFRYKVTTTKC